MWLENQVGHELGSVYDVNGWAVHKRCGHMWHYECLMCPWLCMLNPTRRNMHSKASCAVGLQAFLITEFSHRLWFPHCQSSLASLCKWTCRTWTCAHLQHVVPPAVASSPVKVDFTQYGIFLRLSWLGEYLFFVASSVNNAGVLCMHF